MNPLEKNFDQPTTIEAEETMDFSKIFEWLSKKIAPLQGEPISDFNDRKRSFEVNTTSIKIAVVDNHSVNTKVLYKENNAYYYKRTFWDISETLKIENPQEFEKVSDEILDDVIKLNEQKNITLYQEHHHNKQQESKDADSILEQKLSQLD